MCFGCESVQEPRFCQLTELRKQLEEESRVQYVVLHLNLMNWSFMDSEVRVRTNCSLYELKAKLAAKHGAMVDLRVNTLKSFACMNAPSTRTRRLDPRRGDIWFTAFIKKELVGGGERRNAADLRFHGIASQLHAFPIASRSVKIPSPKSTK